MHVFSTWEGLLLGLTMRRVDQNRFHQCWQMKCKQNQISPDVQHSSTQMPISPSPLMCLMRNHSVGESPNLCKHTVSIDLFGGDMSLLGLARRLPFLQLYNGWPGRDTTLDGALEAVTAITIEISYWGQVMRTDRLWDGSISDIDTRRGRTNWHLFLFHVQRSLCVRVSWVLCVRILVCVFMGGGKVQSDHRKQRCVSNSNCKCAVHPASGSSSFVFLHWIRFNKQTCLMRAEVTSAVDGCPNVMFSTSWAENTEQSEGNMSALQTWVSY